MNERLTKIRHERNVKAVREMYPKLGIGISPFEAYRNYCHIFTVHDANAPVTRHDQRLSVERLSTPKRRPNFWDLHSKAAEIKVYFAS